MASTDQPAAKPAGARHDRIHSTLTVLVLGPMLEATYRRFGVSLLSSVCCWLTPCHPMRVITVPLGNHPMLA
jgi:hypothetical protein